MTDVLIDVLNGFSFIVYIAIGIVIGQLIIGAFLR